MRVSLRIATVLSRGERPFVELVFDDEVVRLSLEEARRARDWMSFAGTWLRSASTLELGDAIDKAFEAITAQPARVVEDHVLGALQGQFSSGEPAWIELSVQSGVRETHHPRIELSIGESLAVDEQPFYGDTWWIDSLEAAELASMIRAGEGSLGDFLHVRTALDPEHERTEGVELRFADNLLEEHGDDGILWLATPNARRVADWLDAAITWARENPPHVWLPPEPDPVTIAEITTQRPRA